MQELPKHVKRKLRALAAQAYEAELAGELSRLAERFDDWRTGRIDAWQLSDHIHKFHNGPSRELYGRYNDVSPNIAVAYALSEGILKLEDVPADVRPYLASALAFYRDIAGRAADGAVEE